MKKLNPFTRAVGVVALALPLMANQSCEQPLAGAVRKLQMGVGVVGVKSQKFQAPGGVVVDFSVPVSTQLEEVVQNHADFYLAGRVPKMNEMDIMEATDEDAPTCVRNAPLFNINGDVTHFEFLSSFGMRFGYSPDGDLGGISVDGTVKVDTAQMGLTLRAYDPLTLYYKAISSSTSNETKTRINANINFKGFQAGPEFYFQTPLEKVGRSAVEKALAKLSTKLAEVTWESQVIKDKDIAIIINAGKNAGLQVGDVLTVHNQIYEWEDNNQPCESPLSYRIDQRPGVPTAVITLGEVYDDYSVSTAQIERPTFERVMSGAAVRLKQFKPEPQSTQK
ncbi:MAG: hypothetical protein AB7F59_02945 [Bdellovibrionales bacterium]